MPGGNVKLGEKKNEAAPHRFRSEQNGEKKVSHSLSILLLKHTTHNGIKRCGTNYRHRFVRGIVWLFGGKKGISILVGSFEMWW